MNRFGYVALVALVGLSTMCCGARCPGAVATFELRDHLDRTWQNELVFFAVPEKVAGRKDLVLIGPEGKEVAYQWVDPEVAPSGKRSIAFLASVARFGRSTYRLEQGKPTTATDLVVQEDVDVIVLKNRRIGITLGGGERAVRHGPIQSIRLPSGPWVGDGKLSAPKPPTRVVSQIDARGPVFAEVAFEYEYPDGGYWRPRFRVIAGEPVVLIDEEFELPSGSQYSLDLSKGWEADHLFFRNNQNRCETLALDSVKSQAAFRMKPWPAWWGETQGDWVGMFREKGDDLLAIGVREPGVWVTPGRTKWDTVVDVDKELNASFPLRGFQRKWMLIGLKRAEAIVPEEMGKSIAPLPQQYVIRYGEFPLDMVKDYVLAWDDRATRHPRLFTTAEELKRFRQRFAADPNLLEKLRKGPIRSSMLDDAVAQFLATGDKELGRRLAELALRDVQASVDGYVRQEKLRNPGSCPHHRNPKVYAAAIVADLVLQGDVLTSDERMRLKAQLAFLGYTLARPLVISPERGFQANPNMTSMARGMLGTVACTIPNHPAASSWGKTAIAEMERELDEWCGPGGGWLEAPHYATVSLDALISLALAVRGTGFSQTDWAHHPKLRSAVAWLTKISTPPDPRLDGHRHMPAIGNSYLGERTCLPGWMATIWRDADPAFSSEMQWHWKAQGMPKTPGIGGAYPGLHGYRHVMLDAALPSKAPKDGTTLFPDAGAVFRTGFPGKTETYLHYIQGPMHQHYDYDEGSFVLWGLGSPLCEDFGYYGRAPAADHSRVVDSFSEVLGAEGKIREFAAGDSADYLRGERGGWHRQILFAKDAKAETANFFVIRDTVLSGRTFDWRVWIATDDAIDPAKNPMRAKGRFGVDLVVFFLEPTKRTVTTEQATRTAGTAGWGHDKRTTSQRCLQMKNLAGDQAVSVVLFPVRKDDPTPKFRALADGRVVRVDHASGTDYAMLAREPFDFQHDGVEFHGRAGVAQIRGDKTHVSLPCKGKLKCRGRECVVE